MNKKLLTLAIGAALAAGAVVANADVSTYGRMHVSLDNMKNNDPSATTTTKGMNISSNSSRFGVKGSDDFGGGMKGIFQWETDVSADEGSPAFQNRNSYGGIAGGFGTVILGRHDSPYKSSTGRLDPFSETIGDYNAIMGAVPNDGTKNNTVLDNRISNALMYTTPDMSGLSASIMMAYGTGAKDLNGGSANGFDNQDNKITALSGSYSQGPIFATLAMESHKEVALDAINTFGAAGAGVKASATKLGVGYDLGMGVVGVALENWKVSAPGGDTKGTNTFLSFSMKLAGNSNVALSYAMADDTDSGGATGDDKATMLSLGYFQGMSKTSKAYVVFSKMDNKGLNANYTLGNSGHGDIVTAVAGKDVSGLSAGMIIDF